ncbi:MaoC/PaaZ C-terminal domain-containing protein [Xanthobacteraceae bacterium A53D]
MFNPDTLLNYKIPAVDHAYAEKDAAFYALSIGLGQDPTDERQLRFVDYRKNPATVPSMSVILAYPGLWIANPDAGLDHSRALHAEQEFSLAAPLPASGVLKGTTRVVGLYDKGPGKAALLVTEKELTDSSGAVVARTRGTTFLRGYGGFDGQDAPAVNASPLPSGNPSHIVDLCTRPEQALFYRLLGDDNALHADPASARRSGFDRPILHGLCTFGVICHALLRSLADYDAARLTGMRLRFSSPVYPGETIRTEVWPCGGFRARVVERDTIVASHGQAVLQ